ncbi:MAG: YybS family protein, partial [Caulobacteraceae bacterium]
LGIISMVWPVPVIIVGYRNGLKASILSALSAALIVSLVTYPLVGLGLFAGFGIPGIIMGYMINKRINPHLIILVCGVVLSLTMVAEFLLSLMAAGLDIVGFFKNLDATMAAQMDKALVIYRQLGVSEKDIKYFKDFWALSVQMIKIILPSSLLMGGIFFSLIDFKLTRTILKRIGHDIGDIKEFAQWRIPEPYSFILIALAIASTVVSYFKVPGLEAVALNVSSVIMFIFTIVGISVVVYYSRVFGDKYDVPKPVRTILVVLLVLFFARFIVLIGIIDITLNFRRLQSRNSGGAR